MGIPITIEYNLENFVVDAAYGYVIAGYLQNGCLWVVGVARSDEEPPEMYRFYGYLKRKYQQMRRIDGKAR